MGRSRKATGNVRQGILGTNLAQECVLLMKWTGKHGWEVTFFVFQDLICDGQGNKSHRECLTGSLRDKLDPESVWRTLFVKPCGRESRERVLAHLTVISITSKHAAASAWEVPVFMFLM